MNKYLVTVNSKNHILENVINNQVFEMGNPLQELRKRLPEYEIQRCNGMFNGWTIMLWNKEKNIHLYYIAKRK